MLACMPRSSRLGKSQTSQLHSMHSGRAAEHSISFLVILHEVRSNLCLHKCRLALHSDEDHAGVGDGLVFLHAAIRTPNLKARLASAREEFRAVWYCP